jgi:hypothetical protein
MGTSMKIFEDAMILVMIICMISTVVLFFFFMFDMKTVDTWSVETRAVCDENLCQDFVITCHAGIPVQIRPIGNQVNNLRNVTTQEFCR